MPLWVRLQEWARVLTVTNDDIYTKLKLFDSGQAHALVAAGKEEWADTFKPENDRHCANVRIVADYEYQLEIYLEDIFNDFPHVVLVVCDALGRSWVREATRFVPGQVALR